MKRDVRVGNHASIMKVIRTSDVRKKPVKEKNVPFLRCHSCNLFAIRNVLVVSTLNWGIKTFRMVIEPLHDTCQDFSKGYSGFTKQRKRC